MEVAVDTIYNINLVHLAHLVGTTLRERLGGGREDDYSIGECRFTHILATGPDSCNPGQHQNLPREESFAQAA